jgi:hypothetical protein
MQPRRHQVVQLDQHWCGNDEQFGGSLNEGATGGVIRITPIEGGVQRPSVDD